MRYQIILCKTYLNVNNIDKGRIFGDHKLSLGTIG